MSGRRSAVVLAAGQGTRMRSSLVKVLHAVAGRPMIARVVDAALGAGCDPVIVVVGVQGERVRRALDGEPRVRFAVQRAPRGTGDAVAAAAAEVAALSGTVLLLPGDVPLMRSSTLARLAEEHERGGRAVTVLTMELDDPRWYGRVIRGAGGEPERIVEARDCDEEQRAVREINTGIYAADVRRLFGGDEGDGLLGDLTTDNDQGELYLTDIVAGAVRRGWTTAAVRHDDGDEVRGVNDREELARAEEILYARVARRWMADGVTVRAPGSVRIDPEVRLAPDAVLEPGVALRGATTVGEGARIGRDSTLLDCTVGARTVIEAGCVLTAADLEDEVLVRPYTVMTGLNEKDPEGSTEEHRVRVGRGCRVGPFAHLRAASTLGADVHLGNFVETKKTEMLEGAKANHLAYLGDGTIGRRSNVGAGVIFCNYDGLDKHHTVIGDDAFVGSDSQLVAPVSVGDRAYVGSGTTVTRDVPAGSLMVTRARPQVIGGAGDRKAARIARRRAAAGSGGEDR